MATKEKHDPCKLPMQPAQDTNWTRDPTNIRTGSKKAKVPSHDCTACTNHAGRSCTLKLSFLCDHLLDDHKEKDNFKEIKSKPE